MNWITCPGCGLKHSPRADGLCPRCRTRTGGAEPTLAPPTPGAGDFGAPPGWGPGPGEPLPTSPWGGEPPQAPAGTPAPVTVGSLLSRTFSAWWANVGRFGVTLLIVYVPVFVAGAVAAISVSTGVRHADAPAERAAALQGMLPFLVAGGLGSLLLGVAQIGGVTFGTLQHLAGRRAGVGQMFGAGFRRFWPLLLGFLAALFVIWGGLLLLVVPGVLLALGLATLVPVIVAEDGPGVATAFRRSFALTKGSRGSIFGAVVVLILAMWGASLVGNLAMLAAAASPALGVVGFALSLIVQLAMTPLTTVLGAVAYHDLRIAKEGVDTSRLARVFE